VKPKKERKNPWVGLTEEQRTERLAAMKRGRELKKQEKRRLSEDSLAAAEAAPAPAPAPKTLEEMGAKELFAVYMGLTGKPIPPEGSWAGLPAEFHGKDKLLNEIRRLQAAPVAEDAASETSSKKRKNPWADLTPEQKAERVAKMQAAKAAKKAASATEGSA
jgi:hypothetical protein